MTVPRFLSARSWAIIDRPYSSTAPGVKPDRRVAGRTISRQPAFQARQISERCGTQLSLKHDPDPFFAFNDLGCDDANGNIVFAESTPSGRGGSGCSGSRTAPDAAIPTGAQ